MKASVGPVPLFNQVGQLIKVRMQRALPLPLAQCQALWFISQNEQPNMQEVAKHFKITAPSATFLIDELVKASLVGRRPAKGDRRKVELALTKKGKAQVKVLSQKREKVMGAIFKSLSPEDRADLNRILKNILDNA